MIDREALWEALDAFVTSFNTEGPDDVLRHATRLLAPFLVQILHEADEELAANIRTALEGLP